jgi:hypothetical protein
VGRAAPALVAVLEKEEVVENSLLAERAAELLCAGCNPPAKIDPGAALFCQEWKALAEALLKIGSKDREWTESALGLMAGVLMRVVKAPTGED